MSGSGAEADTEGQGSQLDIGAAGKKETKPKEPPTEGETPEALLVSFL